jgi:hypothetical protein
MAVLTAEVRLVRSLSNDLIGDESRCGLRSAE